MPLHWSPVVDSLPDLATLAPQAGARVLAGLGLEEQANHFALTFARVSGAVMLIPGFGEPSVPARVRLLFALALSVAAMPAAAVVTHDALLPGIVAETLIGIAMGLLVRLFHAAVITAGSYIAASIGVAGAIFFDPAQGGETTAVTRLVGTAALLLLLALDLHHLFLRGLIGSYALPLASLGTDSWAEGAVAMMRHASVVALGMAAPFIAYGLLFNLALGLLSRLTPQIQLFFIAQPLNLLGGLGLLCVALGGALLLFARAFGDLAASTIA